MSIDALALRVKKIASGKGIQSKVKMLIFYYALKAANLLQLASYSLGMMELMDSELFNELSLNIGMSLVGLPNDIHIKNETIFVDCIHIETQIMGNINNTSNTNNINIMNNMNNMNNATVEDSKVDNSAQNEIEVENENPHPHPEQEQQLNIINSDLKTEIKIENKYSSKDRMSGTNIENAPANEIVKIKSEIIPKCENENSNRSKKRSRVAV